MAAQPLEQVHRSDRVDVEVLERHLRREIVRRLRGAVDDQVERLRASSPSTASRLRMSSSTCLKRLALRSSRLLVPARVAVRAEEDGAHVVVDADDVRAELVEIRDRFGADEPVGPGNQNAHA